jgi:hypothetical protein
VFLSTAPCFGQPSANGLIEAARTWLKNASTGARAELLAATDPRFIATTPAGDVLGRERLIPSDTSQPVQQLPLTELDGPLSRAVGDTGVVVSRLKSAAGQELNATFVFVRQPSVWILMAIHLSPIGR